MKTMNLKKTSLYSGIGFLVLGLFLLILGLVLDANDNENIPDTFGIYWMATGSAFIVGLMNSLLKDGITKSVYFSRIIVGALFVVSGIIKANDPLGFSFKLEEYFEPNALGWTIFEPYSLGLSIFIAGSEIVLGLAVLMGGLIRISSWALLGMILFFAWLTHYTASCNDAMHLAQELGETFDKQCVLDCGCFGDALRGSIGRSLTPWESFFKDLVLLILVIPIVIMQKRIKFNSWKDDAVILPGAIVFAFIMGVVLFGWWLPLLFMVFIFGAYALTKYLIKGESKQVFLSASIAVLASFTFVFYTYTYLPVKDYRPYAIGNNLFEKMNDGVLQINNDVMVYKHKTTGKEKTMTQDEYMKNWEEVEANYEFVDRKTEVVKEGHPASIVDFRPYKYYELLTEEQKSDTLLSQEIAEEYDQYYNKVHVLKNVRYDYIDSVIPQDYDPSYYPISDSTWEYLGLVEQQLDPNKRLEVDFTKYLLHLEKALFVTSYDFEHYTTLTKRNEYSIIHKENWTPIVTLIKEAQEKNIPVFVLTSASPDMTNLLQKELDFEAECLIMDGIELKIMVRSNPGVLYLEKGTVKGKWDLNRIPVIEELSN